MKNILLRFTLLLICFGNSIIGQNKTTMDSLNLALKNAKHDTTRIRIYLALCEECELQDNLKYAQPAFNIISKILPQTKDSVLRTYLLKRKIDVYNYFAAYSQYKDGANSPKQLEYIEKELSVYKEMNDIEGIAYSYVKFANYYDNQGELMKMLESLKKGLSFTKANHYKEGMAMFIGKIGFLYAEQGDTLQALNYAEKGINLEKEIGDTNRITRGYFLMGVFQSKIKRYQKSLEYYRKALLRYQKQNNQEMVAQMYLYIGETYIARGNNNEAIENFQKAIEIAKPINELRTLVGSLINLGNVYLELGDYKKAIEYHEESIEISKTSNQIYGVALGSLALSKDYYRLGNFIDAKKNSKITIEILNNLNVIPNLCEAEEIAYKIDSASHNFNEAFRHYQSFIKLKTQLDNQEILKSSAKEKFQNEYEKIKLTNRAEQDKKDALNAEEKNKQKIVTYSIGLVLVLVIIFFALLYRRFRITKTQKTIIEIQKLDVENAKHLVEEKHKEITDSINYAERIQKTFLASNDLLNQHLHNYFILFKPKDVVSGDFYWAETLPNGNFILATADSTGHGVPGAIMSLLNITSLEKAIEHLSDPAEILNHTRQTIINRLKRDGSKEGGKDGMDCSVIVFDFKNLQLHIAAAHNPVWIVRKRYCEGDSLKQSQTIDEIASLPRNDESLELIEIKPDKMPVGKHDRDQESFTSHSIKIKEGDIIFTLTDGFPDQFGGDKGKKFMSKNLKDLLLANAHLPMNEQKDILHQAFTKWIGDLEQVDDVTLIGIKI